MSDGVLHASLGGTGTSANLGLAVPGLAGDATLLATVNPKLAARGDHSAFLVSESEQGEDRNGDGDTLDWILHAFDVSPGALRNLALAVEPPLIQNGGLGPKRPPAMKLTDETLVFHVSEKKQGNTDLNSDGNLGTSTLDDTALFVHVLGTPIVRNLGLTAWQYEEVGGLLAFEVLESMQGQDLNQNGTQSDLVAHVHDVAAGTTWNLGVATVRPFDIGRGFRDLSPFQIHGHWVALPVIESASGSDSNGDGDAVDTVLFLANASTHQLVSTGLAVAADELQDADRARFHPSGILALLVSEKGQGNTDLNGDGDVLDLVLHFLDPETGELLSAGVAATPPLLPSHGRWYPFTAGEDYGEFNEAPEAVLRVALVRM